MAEGFEGTSPPRPPRGSGSVLAAAGVVWCYAFLGTLLGLGMFAAAAARYPYRKDDMVVGLVITVLSGGNIALGVLMVRGRGWARITVNVLTAFWIVIEIYAAFRVEVPLLILTPAMLNIVLLALLNSREARAYFAAKGQSRADGRADTAPSRSE